MVTIDSNQHRFAQMRPEAMIERSWPRWSTRLPACHGCEFHQLLSNAFI
jgi:hypothetical protein